MRYTAQCLGAIILTVAASSVASQESDCSIEELSGRGSTETANSNFACLSAQLRALQAENERLKADLQAVELVQGPSGPQGVPGPQGPPGSDVSIPNGAVLIFDRPQGCPNGWINMGADWRGKAIVAAASDPNDKYGFGRTGGAENHTLTINELPAHSHSFSGRDFTRGGWGGQAVLDFAVGGSSRVSSLPPAGSIGETGRDRPHNNMPPYLALFMCKKM